MSEVQIEASGSEVLQGTGRSRLRPGEVNKWSVRSARREAGNRFHANSGVLLEVEDNCRTVDPQTGKGEWWRCAIMERVLFFIF